MVSYISVHLNHTAMKYLLLLIATSLLFSCKKTQDPTPQFADINTGKYELYIGYSQHQTLLVTIDGDTSYYSSDSPSGGFAERLITKSAVVTYKGNGIGYIQVRAVTINPPHNSGYLYLEVQNPTSGTLDLSSLPK